MLRNLTNEYLTAVALLLGQVFFRSIPALAWAAPDARIGRWCEQIQLHRAKIFHLIVSIL